MTQLPLYKVGDIVCRRRTGVFYKIIGEGELRTRWNGDRRIVYLCVTFAHKNHVRMKNKPKARYYHYEEYFTPAQEALDEHFALVEEQRALILKLSDAIYEELKLASNKSQAVE